MVQPRGRPAQENTASQHLHPSHNTDVQHKHLNDGHFLSQMLLWHFMRAQAPCQGQGVLSFTEHYCTIVLNLEHGKVPPHPCLPFETLPCWSLGESFIDCHSSSALRLTVLLKNYIKEKNYLTQKLNLNYFVVVKMSVNGEAMSLYPLWIGSVVDFGSSLDIHKARVTSRSQQLRDVLLRSISTCSRTATRDKNKLILRWGI